MSCYILSMSYIMIYRKNKAPELKDLSLSKEVETLKDMDEKSKIMKKT